MFTMKPLLRIYVCVLYLFFIFTGTALNYVRDNSPQVLPWHVAIGLRDKLSVLFVSVPLSYDTIAVMQIRFY